MQLVGFNTQQLRYGVCQRRTAKRQGGGPPGLTGADALAKHIVKLNLQDLAVGFNGGARLGEVGGLWRQGHRHGGWHGWRRPSALPAMVKSPGRCGSKIRAAGCMRSR